MLPSITGPAWFTHNKKVSTSACRTAKTCCLDKILGKLVEEVIDILVTVDGTWQKCGCNSLFGVVVVDSWLTGKVLDAVVLSKDCQERKLKLATGIGEEDFDAWRESEHKEACSINYSASSKAMEVEGTKIFWFGSVKDLKLCYTTYIGNGDSKAFSSVRDFKPYGPNIEIVKQECVGHVQNRLGTALKKLKKQGAVDEKGLPVKFKERLTDDNIKALNIYYRGTIRNNLNDVDAMARVIDASFLHSMSTDEDPRHQKCPDHNPPDAPSWYKFKVAEYACTSKDEFIKEHGLEKFDEVTHVKHRNPPLIPPDLAKYTRPVYQGLANCELLHRCKLGGNTKSKRALIMFCGFMPPKHSI